MVVERMPSAQRDALRVGTPLAAFIERAARESAPRHVVLTGNAGDGKTFAALTSDASAFWVETDASADTSGRPPIEALADRLEGHLAGGERLLVAINRGQLERLAEHAASGPRLREFLAEAREQSTLKVSWEGQVDADVAVLDLGLVDWTSPGVTDPLLDKVADADLSAVTGDARRAAEQACAALKQPHVRAWFRRVLAGVRAEGRHLTMRQIWSYLAYLVTGGIGQGESARVLSVADTVGARLFSYDARRTPLENALPAADPARRPLPDVATLLLQRRAHEHLTAMPGIGPLAAEASQCTDGVAAARAAVVHDPGRRLDEGEEDLFSSLFKRLVSKPPAWHKLPSVTRPLLQGAYRALSAWNSDPAFPAWQTLCYDSVRFGAAPSVANGDVAPESLRLALPRPPPRCDQALSGTWRPPYVWLGAERNGSVDQAGALRLPPTLFRLLYGGGGPLPTATSLVIARWLARLPTQQDPDRVRVSRAAEEGVSRSLLITSDDLTGRIRIEEV
ncbi:MAG TPA: hypothetical protein VFS43_01470 [Polyangiaceae bacterium]|nr:hypothetical protein [Polyangiaceae bacterium]